MEHSEPFSMLPSELIAQVAGYLDPRSLNTFRVACKHINEVVVYNETDKKIYSEDIATCVKHNKTDLVKRHLDAYPDDPTNIKYMVQSTKAGDMDTFMVLLDHFYKPDLKDTNRHVWYQLISIINKCIITTEDTPIRLFITKAFLDKYEYGLVDIQNHCIETLRKAVYNGEIDDTDGLLDMRLMEMVWIEPHNHTWYHHCAQLDDVKMNSVLVLHRTMCATAVSCAIEYKASKMLDVLLENGFAVPDKAFINTIFFGNIDIIRKLIAHGANVNANNGEPLSMSCGMHFRVPIAHLLLDNGANPALNSSFALCRLSKKSRDDDEHAPEDASLQRRMIQMGADVNAEDGSVLYWACRYENTMMVRVLLECGATFNQGVRSLLCNPRFDAKNDIERMVHLVSCVDFQVGHIDKDKRTLALREAFGEISY